MTDHSTVKIISDEILIRNVELYMNGDMEEKKCSECGLSSILHPNPKKHHCELTKSKTESKDNWVNIQLEMMNRMNSTILMYTNKKSRVNDNVNELLVDNLNKLAEKIEKIAVPTSTPPNNNSRAQVIARRSCPSWTAGTTVEVYSRWVKDWNGNDNSDSLCKYMDITKNLSDNKVIPGLREYMKKIVMPSLSATSQENVDSVLEKLAEKYKMNKYEKFEDLIEMIEGLSIKSEDDSQVIWERFLHVMEKVKLLSVNTNLDYFFLTLFLMKGKKANILTSYEENMLRNILGGEEKDQPVDVLKLFGKEFAKLKIQSHRKFAFEKEVVNTAETDNDESVHYTERGRSTNQKFVRSRSNPRFFRRARSQSWNNARSQSRSRSNQTYHRLHGTPYWNNREDSRKHNNYEEDKITQILQSISKISENYENLNKKINSIEDKLKNVNYCEEEVREVHFTESDKVDHEIIIVTA